MKRTGPIIDYIPWASYYIGLAVLVTIITSCTPEKEKVKTDNKSCGKQVSAENSLPGTGVIYLKHLPLTPKDSMGLQLNYSGNFIPVQTKEWPYYTMILTY